MAFLDLLRAEDQELWEVPKFLRADLVEAARTLSRQQARYHVDTYYELQHFRIQSQNQTRGLSESGEPNTLTDYLHERFHQLERQIQRELDVWTQATPIGQWMRAQVGVGPVLAAGFLAQLNADPPPTVGHWWRFCGLDPSSEWLGQEKARMLVNDAKAAGCETPEEALDFCSNMLRRRPENIRGMALTLRLFNGTGPGPETRLSWANLTAALAKRPWNARLKVVCWKLAQSFVKCSGRPACRYGQLYKQRKAYEMERNAQGLYREQAEQVLKTKRIGHDTDAFAHYSEGHLPPAHIQARSERWAVKMFLSHLHEAATVAVHQRLPRKPFGIEKLGHTTWIMPHHMGLIPGWVALRQQGDWAVSPHLKGEGEG